MLRSHHVQLEVAVALGFIIAAIDATVVPLHVNVVNVALVLLESAVLLGFVVAALNVTVSPNYTDVVHHHHVVL